MKLYQLVLKDILRRKKRVLYAALGIVIAAMTVVGILTMATAGEEKIYMGSADLMPRNLNNRVEVLFPIKEQGLIEHLRDKVLKVYLREDLRGWRLTADGSYERICEQPEKEFDIQEWFVKESK